MPSLSYKDAFRASNLSGNEEHSLVLNSTPSENVEGKAPGTVEEPIHLDTDTNTVVDTQYVLYIVEPLITVFSATTPSGDDPKKAKEELRQIEEKSEESAVNQLSTENPRADSKNTLIVAQLEEFMMAQVCFVLGWGIELIRSRSTHNNAKQ